MIFFITLDLPVKAKYGLSDWIPVGVAAVVIIADQLTKLWIMTTFTLYGQKQIIPGFFNLVYVTNTGAACVRFFLSGLL